MRRGRSQKENRARDGDGETEFSAETRRTSIHLGWLIGFGVLIWALGIVYSIPIYVFGYLKIIGKYSWLKSGIFAAAATAVIVILFEYVFRVAWPDAALLSILHL
jgi:cytochrome c oxidase subunit IV